MQGRFYRGVLWVMGNTAHVVKRYPDIKKYFILISTASGKQGWAKGGDEDIHGLTQTIYGEDYQRSLPGRHNLVIRNADFIDENDFYEVAVQKQYDIFFNSVLWKVKRHELFLATLYDLRNRYQRDIKAAVILWSGPPRLRNSRIYPKLFYRFVTPLLNQKAARNYASRIRQLYEKALNDGLHIDLIDPIYRSEKNAIASLRLLYNKSKIYVLLSETEGLNRTAKEAILCNTPVLVINGSTTAREFVNSSTGKAVADTQKDISEGILDLLDQYRLYSPRSWALKHAPRMLICQELWEKINEVQKFPGYPSIHQANEIRQLSNASPRDNHFDLNNWKGVASTGSLAKEMRRIRKRYSCLPQNRDN
jgi:hypothetical protein